MRWRKIWVGAAALAVVGLGVTGIGVQTPRTPALHTAHPTWTLSPATAQSSLLETALPVGLEPRPAKITGGWASVLSWASDIIDETAAPAGSRVSQELGISPEYVCAGGAAVCPARGTDHYSVILAAPAAAKLSRGDLGQAIVGLTVAEWSLRHPDVPAEAVAQAAPAIGRMESGEPVTPAQSDDASAVLAWGVSRRMKFEAQKIVASLGYPDTQIRVRHVATTCGRIDAAACVRTGHPVIYVQPMATWSHGMLRAVLAHELIHTITTGADVHRLQHEKFWAATATPKRYPGEIPGVEEVADCGAEILDPGAWKILQADSGKSAYMTRPCTAPEDAEAHRILDAHPPMPAR